jgi:DDE superfamily endonuclease/Helix-turn-helix of DDE superfamily endonuclease
MILREAYLRQHPHVFKVMTGLTVPLFDDLCWDVRPLLAEAVYAERTRPGRQRAVGAGHPYALHARDQILLTVIWLRQYPTQEALGYFFGVSDSAVLRTIRRVLPVLEQAGRATMRRPAPPAKQRRGVDALLRDVPELQVIVDSFEQRCQRPQDRKEADGYYAGKKKMHTLKSQVAVDRATGDIVDVPESVPGPTADLTLLKQSGLLGRLAPDCDVGGDLGYVGIAKLHARGHTPRRKPRGKPRPPEDIVYNQAFARQRITVEHSIGEMRRFACLTQTDRHRRQQHTPRVCAVAGLVNRRHRRHERRRAA